MSNYLITVDANYPDFKKTSRVTLYLCEPH